jgi:hypothetical protein
MIAKINEGELDNDTTEIISELIENNLLSYIVKPEIIRTEEFKKILLDNNLVDKLEPKLINQLNILK